MVPVIEVDGARIPAVGLGTMTLRGDVCVEAVSAALRMGYRHIDPASFYARFRAMGADEAQAFGKMVWDAINLPNLRDHISPARAQADLVVRKGGDHAIIGVNPA